ncbi:MAG: M23 family metallopeptidase [Candidatus Omnitrophica bacterium]|nr:M23 family metallopeptidase [Candidatus Omnitrophota bacterium]
MKKILLILVIILPIYLLATVYFLGSSNFVCPIKYENGIVIRCDNHGEGHFAANRSGNRLHNGIDLLAEVGTPIFSSRWGRVVSAKQNRGMGKYVVIRHRGNITTIYGHLSEILVFKGQFIRQGQVIGKVGKTGNANYRDILPHLHFEVRKDGIPQDPLQFLQ